MNTQSVGYRTKTFEARNLAFFFLISLGFQLLVGWLTYTGLLHTPQSFRDPVLIPWILFNIPVLLGPSTAAFVVAGLTEGKPGVKELWMRFWNRNVSLKWLLVAMLILPILRLIAAILTQILSDTSYPFLVEGNVWEVLIIPIGMGLFSGIHEEFGWRGYALPRFQAKWNTLISSTILGVITALWHLPGFITPGEPLFGRNFWEWLPWHMLIQIVGFSWIFNNTKGNVLAVILFHTTTSLSLFVVDFTYYWILLIAAILIVIIFGAKDFVRLKQEQELDRMNNRQSFLAKFFGAAIRSQTYLNLVYLFLTFPLGLFYFMLLVTGFSLGFGLLIVWVGALILPMMFVAGWACAVFERQLAIWLLHEDIPPMKRSALTGMRTWDQIKSYLANPVTWKSLAYLLVKFPLGILTFVVLVTLITLTLAFLAAPVIYRFFPMEVVHFGISAISIDTLWKAIISFFVGVALLFSTLHISNGLAWISGRFAKAMLS